MKNKFCEIAGKECSAKSLSQVVACFCGKAKENFKDELQYFCSGTNEQEIIQRACDSILPDGKVHSHQCRVGKNALSEARSKLNDFEFERFKRFDALHSAVGKKIGDIKRIGILAVYDIALRLGYAVNLLPEQIFLHAGALEGAKELRRIDENVQ